MAENIFENSFTDDDVKTFTEFLDFIDDHADLTMKPTEPYKYCTLRNKMIAIRKKCHDHVLEFIERQNTSKKREEDK